MPDRDRPTCPITGRPLPDGHTIHPSLAGEIHDAANRIAAVIPETYKHTLVFDETRSQLLNI